MIKEKVLASRLKEERYSSQENLAILCISKDNRTVAFNVCSNKERADGRIPGSVILTEQPLDNFKVISRIVSDNNFPNNLLAEGNNRIIANSLADKLKTHLIFSKLIECF